MTPEILVIEVSGAVRRRRWFGCRHRSDLVGLFGCCTSSVIDQGRGAEASSEVLTPAVTSLSDGSVSDCGIVAACLIPMIHHARSS